MQDRMITSLQLKYNSLPHWEIAIPKYTAALVYKSHILLNNAI